jgi:hypothetical protein
MATHLNRHIMRSLHRYLHLGRHRALFLAYPVNPYSHQIYGDKSIDAGFFRLPVVGVCDNRIGMALFCWLTANQSEPQVSWSTTWTSGPI